MGCPFAQLSPLLLLSCLVLFFQFGASFLSPKPLLASLQRGRSLAGERCGEKVGTGAGFGAAMLAGFWLNVRFVFLFF